MQVSILGPLLVEDGARPVEIGGARLRALLIRLAADPGRWVPLASLAAALWVDDLPHDEVNALQSLVSRLRRVLPHPGLVESGPAGYRLALPPEAVDAVRFERAAAEGRRLLAGGRFEDAVRVLTEALAAWRGVALADVADVPYAAAWAQKLHELRLGAVDDRIEAELELGRHRDLVPELEDLAARDPLRERTRGLLMRALSGSGRQAEALAAYEQLRRTLADELGLDPSPQLRELHLAVLRGEAAGPAPAPTVPRGRRSNLRSALTSFVGREDDVRGLREQLTRSRLVTLVGAGGAGKTRLAGEVAAGLDGVGADGVWMVELAPVTDPNDVASATLGSIRSTETATLERTAPAHRDALSRLVETLADHRVVLILDNCEHLVDAAAKLAEQLLGQCPGLTVLATSREPLAIMGESLWPVRPLPAPDGGHETPDLAAALATPAVELFADRAALVRPGFAVTEANLAAVVEICRRLDGLPLAIELAAARLRSLPVEVVAARLSDRFRLLAGGSRTAMPRHQTLRAVVAWSWDLLTESERRLAERLSVFTGGATAETAEAVCSHVDEPAGGAGDAVVLPDEVPDLLAALADKSLLVVMDGAGTLDGGQPRYRMLETIREFSTERLAERGEIGRMRALHAKYFLDLAEFAEPKLRGPDQLVWLDRMTAERDNLLAALRHAAEVADADTAIRLGAALSWYWTLRGRHDEAAVWLELALSVPGESSPSAHLLVKVLHTLSAAAAGQVMPSEEQTDEFVGLARQLDLTRAHPLISLIEPAIALLRDDSEAGQAAIDRHLVDADPWARAMLHMMRCAMAENDGDLERLEASLPVARKSFEDVGDRWGIAAAISAQALLTAGRGDVEGAIADLQTARRLMTELQANEDESYTLIRIAGLRMRIGDLETARRDLDLADQTAERIGNLWGTVSTRISRAVLAAYEGDQSTGRRLAAEAVALAEQITSGPPQLRGSTHAVAAMFDVRAGDFDLARSRLGVAYEATITSRDMPVGAMVALAAADLDTAMDHPRRAAELVGVATQLRGYADTTDLEYLRIERDLRNRLGAQEFARRYEQGAELTRPEALELLRSVVRPEGEPSIGLPQHKGGVISPPQ